MAALLVLLGGAAWLVLAPTRVGGSTDYVTTHGISMAPRFHSGDLALIRPARAYRVGDVVAYRSAMLRSVVLHRIIRRDGERFVFKGDNNNFIDPAHPGRAELVGKLWLRIPHAGVVLDTLHLPAVAGGLIGSGLLLLLSAGGKRRRRRRRPPAAPAVPEARPAATWADPPAPAPPAPAPPREPASRPRAARRINPLHLLTGSAVAAAAFLVLGLLSFGRPATKPARVNAPYTEKVSFGYSAAVPATAEPVYPGGVLKTGDPVFLRLVHRVRVTVGYDFSATAPHALAGTMDVAVRLSSPNGWSRTMQLAPPKPFAADAAGAEVTLDLARLRSLMRRIDTLIGAPAGGGYTIAVVPRLHVKGRLAGRPLSSDYAPALSFQLDALKMRPGSAATASAGDGQGGLTPNRRGSVATSKTVANTLSVRGHELPVTTTRWIALGGFLLAAAGVLFAVLLLRRRPADPAARIQARHGNLIVPIAAMAPDAGRPPIDVVSFEALVQLAERSERLILHHHGEHADTYLVDDLGTMYRYQARPTVPPPPPAPASPQIPGIALAHLAPVPPDHGFQSGRQPSVFTAPPRSYAVGSPRTALPARGASALRKRRFAAPALA